MKISRRNFIASLLAFPVVASAAHRSDEECGVDPLDVIRHCEKTQGALVIVVSPSASNSIRYGFGKKLLDAQSNRPAIKRAADYSAYFFVLCDNGGLSIVRFVSADTPKRFRNIIRGTEPTCVVLEAGCQTSEYADISVQQLGRRNGSRRNVSYA